MTLEPNDKGVFGPSNFEAVEKKEIVRVSPSAAGGKMKVEGGTVTPSSFEASEGVVGNEGVRTVGVGKNPPRTTVKTVSSPRFGPTCPSCGNNSLKIRMNRKAGQRVYCSTPGCDYDQATLQQGAQGTKVNPNVKVLDSRINPASESRGVRIITSSSRIG